MGTYKAPEGGTLAALGKTKSGKTQGLLCTLWL